jgi:hypothetical protein
MLLYARVRAFTEAVCLEIRLRFLMAVDDIKLIKTIDRPFPFYPLAAYRVTALSVDDASFLQL